MREIRGKTHCPDCAACNREIECSKFQPAEKCNFFFFFLFFFGGVDKVLEPFGLILPAQSQMKLFVGKINPLPSPPSTPPRPCVLRGFCGFLGLLELRASHSHLCLCLGDCHILCCTAKQTHTHTHRREDTIQSLLGARSITKLERNISWRPPVLSDFFFKAQI